MRTTDTSSIIDSIDIVKEISKYVQLTPKGGEYTSCCPFHVEDTPSFFVNPQKRLFYCFGCQAGGNVINFRSMIAGLQLKDAVLALANDYGLQVQNISSKQPLKDCLIAAQSIYLNALPSSSNATTYLTNRGFKADTLTQFGVGYVPDEWQVLTKDPKINKKDALVLGMLIKKNDRVFDRFRGRITFPIHDHLGTIVGFGGRVIGDAKPKYLNSTDSELYHKREVLYGLFHAIQAKSKHIILVEGYLDVIALHQAGFKGAVASLGTAFTSEQFKLVCQYADQLTFCFDGDRAGYSAAEKAFQTILPLIRDQLACAFLFLEDGEDPDSYIQSHGAENFGQRISRATSFTAYLEHRAQSGLNIQILDHQAQFIKRLHEHLVQMPNSITKRLIQKKHTLKIQAELSRVKKTVAIKKDMKEIRLITLCFQYPELFQSKQLLLSSALDELPELCQTAITSLFKEPKLSLASFCVRLQLTYTPSLINQAIDAASVEKEFIDIVQKLRANGIKAKIDQLITKSKVGSLTENEGIMLQALLIKKRDLQKS
ncbi:DNA primase [Gammaproteobacteria bacterium]|nr:DNA primase [Gammaproteobacteria bacterium]